MTQTNLNRWGAIIGVLYLILATIYSVTTPIFEASDELWHYPMVKTIADRGLSLPVQIPGEITTWRQEGSQPPLYYMLAALLTGGVDTSDLEIVRRINPHADIGLTYPDGNVNMIIHRPEAEGFPWRGMVLAAHVARFLSVLLGAGTVGVTFLLASALFPERPVVILGATALTAFLPMFLFISGSANNNNLSNFLGNLLTLEIVLLLKKSRLPSWYTYVVISVTAGVGMLAKFNLGFLLPLIALSLMILSVRHRSPRPLLIGGVISGGLTIGIASWWYLRNWQLYGDPTGLNVFLDIVGRRAIPANLTQLWFERHSFTQAFWGFFGGMNVPLPQTVYSLFDLVGMIGMIGALLFIVGQIARHPINWETFYHALPYALTLIWIGVSFVSYLRWTSETPASQGRLMFATLSSILIWLVVGVTWWLSSRARGIVMGIVTIGCGLTAITAPFIIIAPAYAQPIQANVENFTPIAHYTAQDQGQISLMNAQLITTEAHPEECVYLDLVWCIDTAFTIDGSLFVHLTTADQVIVGQRDLRPGAGRLALSDLEVGQTWTESLAVRLPANVYAPQTVQVEIGWYNLSTREVFALENVSNSPMPAQNSSNLSIGESRILPRPSALVVPNPTNLNFGGMIELVGYDLSDLSPTVGGNTELTLYWRALQPVPDDYVVFVHIVEPATTMRYASSDAQPVGWTRPTTTWAVGELITDTHTLVVHPDTPPAPGIYELEIGLYLNLGDGTFPRLRVIATDGSMANDFAYLSRVRVLPAEDDGS